MDFFFSAFTAVATLVFENVEADTKAEVELPILPLLGWILQVGSPLPNLVLEDLAKEVQGEQVHYRQPFLLRGVLNTPL